ncbi:hypothetical protein MA16_Dca004745 [Dendrobium catenatum]|uniref:Uncharacterized protein n=1 Tax=Dendrobium catenatum TaxID=906689 RepID=A0A2I0VNZ1_9ASPA|nr:hypothetical protein MA16_Dca004745 [Dendrobium catenatum]
MVVLGEVRYLVIREVVADEEVVEVLPCGGRVEGGEGVGGALASKVEEGYTATRVVSDPMGEVVDLNVWIEIHRSAGELCSRSSSSVIYFFFVVSVAIS